MLNGLDVYRDDVGGVWRVGLLLPERGRHEKFHDAAAKSINIYITRNDSHRWIVSGVPNILYVNK